MREAVRELASRRDAVEAEIAEVAARLNAPGQPGETAPLVDAEGFPLAGVDLHRVRADRARLATLHFDHRELSAQLERAVLMVHAATPAESKRQRVEASHEERRPPAAPPQAAAVAEPEATAFAVLDAVAENSPAFAGGLSDGDLVVRFGAVSAEAGADAISRVASSEVRSGVPVAVVVLRRGVTVALQVTPRPWAGRGLLGCHMRPLPAS